MEEKAFFTAKEREQLFALYKRLLQLSGDTLQKGDCHKLKIHLIKAVAEGNLPRNCFGMNPIIKDMQTAVIVAEEIGMKRASILGIMLHESVKNHLCTLASVQQEYGEDVAGIIRGLVKINELYSKSPTIESENFRNLLLSFAEDMRVILIIIADRVNLMRQIKETPNIEARTQVANEAAYLYAPLAHKLGLYKLKSELEDLSLKYTEHDVYYHIKDKLNETKASRDKYIAAFIEPIQHKLEEAGLKFHMKGRTKSIHSIYQKMKKQKCPFEGVYDLFAIRIILDSPVDKEKQECWQVYSIVTDMYMPNPKRLRDWLSVPKSNGYESLHTTVMGPEGKWVEVQIRTERMDEIAERGLAAHWRYKGVKGESGLDEWLTSIRETLENADSDLEVMDQFKLELYEDEVFVFTPKGELKTMPQNSTALDFAFSLHTDIGSHCIGAKVNHKLVPLSHKLQSGDQVEILTSKSQRVQPQWEVFATTARARAKIAAILRKERKANQKIGEELLNEFLKKEEIRPEEAVIEKLRKFHNFKNEEELLAAIGSKAITLGEADKNELREKQTSNWKKYLTFSFGNSNKEKPEEKEPQEKEKINPKEILKLTEESLQKKYIMAECCHPIPGDDVLGYVDENDRIIIHKRQCPVAAKLKSSYGNRILATEWDTHKELSFLVYIYLRGIDSMGLLNEVTQVISRQLNVNIRKLAIETNDGIFEGKIQLWVHDVEDVKTICNNLKKIQNIKQVNRVEE